MPTLKFTSHAPQKPKTFNLITIKNAQKGSQARRNSQHVGKRVVLSVLGVLFALFVIASIIGAIIITGYVGAINAGLPDAGKFATADMEQSTKIYDRNGKLLYTMVDEYNREFVTLSKIPDKTKWALLSAEDIHFYEHKGIDFGGIISAGLDYLRTGGAASRGASTITQQLVRSTVLNHIQGEDPNARTISRKVKEILASFQLENKLTKDQILELYMNQVNLGGTVYGYQTGAHAFFNKDVSQLDLAESAMLAVIIRAPSTYSNDLYNGQTDEVKKFRDIVLDQMLKHKDLTGVTDDEIAKAKDEPIKITPGSINIQAPHFVFFVIQQLEDKFGPDVIKTGGLSVYTTLDLSVQKIAEDELKKDIKNFKTWYGVHNGAVVVENPKNGEILAMVGSVDYNNTKDKRVDGNVNVAVMPRQMGSSVKPYTYLEAIHLGYNPGTVTPDIKLDLGSYKVDDWDFKYMGLLTMHKALNLSRNIPAVYTLQMIGGASTFLTAAKKLGITTLTDVSQYGLSLTVGAGDMRLIEHTNAFATFADKGVRHDTSTIMKVTDSKSNVLFQSAQDKTAKRVYTEEETYLLNFILCQLPPGQQDKPLGFYYTTGGQQLCGKTGTTTGPKDLVTMLYYPKLVVGVWTGNNNGDKTFGTRGQGWSESVPIVIAHNIMAKLQPKYGKESYSRPANVVTGTVCSDTGLVAGGANCPKATTVFINTNIPAKDTAHKMIPICTKTGLVPSNEAEARANGLVKDVMYLDFKLQNPSQQKAYDSYVTSKLKYKLYKDLPASAPCIADIQISFTAPTGSGPYYVGNTVTLKTSVTGPLAITTVKYYVQGNSTPICTRTGADAPNYPCNYTFLTPGTTTFTAIATDTGAQTGQNTLTLSVTTLPTLTPTPTPTPTVTPTP